MRKLMRTGALVFFDFVIIMFSFYAAFYLRFETLDSPQFLQYWPVFVQNWYFFALIKLVTFYLFRLYKSLWRYTSLDELFQIGLAVLASTGLVVSYMVARSLQLPRSIYVLTAVFDFLLLSGVRLSYRLIRRMRHGFGSREKIRRVLIIGGGDAGSVIIRELKNRDQLNRKPVAIIDDDQSKKGSRINQIPIVGNRHQIVSAVEKYQIDEIILAIPSASKAELREIINISKQTSCQIKTVPGLYEFIDGNIDINSLRNIQIEDLLGRDPIDLDTREMGHFVYDKVVLVTGGGGSIGSEIVRQLAPFRPRELVIFDIYENNAYDLQMELLNTYKIELYDHGYSDAFCDFRLRVEIGSVRDEARVKQLLAETKPNIIFHAAAHKHVPLMEQNPQEAIKNNVFGTYNVASAASEYGVEKFVLISTDKAVNPTNVMGATKRLCEMLVQALDQDSPTDYSLVRFGNVLGSNGSVVPLFKKQITEQGYVTVTHPDIIRYFMTIPEAARLVIQSGAMAHGGEIFILDMGEPVKIIDLARDVIRLSGYEPEVDIPIRITGLRPGEKLYEELLMSEEGLQETRVDKIFIGAPLNISKSQIMDALDRLRRVLESGDETALRRLLQEIVPTYHPENGGREMLSEISADETEEAKVSI